MHLCKNQTSWRWRRRRRHWRGGWAVEFEAIELRFWGFGENAKVVRERGFGGLGVEEIRESSELSRKRQGSHFWKWRDEKQWNVNSQRSVCLSVPDSNPVIHNFGFVMLIREEIWDNIRGDLTLLACWMGHMCGDLLSPYLDCKIKNSKYHVRHILG